VTLAEIEQRHLAPEAARAAVLALRICDPAAGCGHFLVVAAERLALALVLPGDTPAARLERWRALVEQCLYAVDIDRVAVAMMRLSLCLPFLQAGLALPDLSRHTVCGDALTGEFGGVASAAADPLAGWHAVFPDATARFDLVIGNPPSIDSERMSREQPDLRRRYARLWSSARGNWDMFVVFIELGLRLTRGDGRCAMIVPNRLLDASYAGRARELLRQSTVEHLHDYSSGTAFGANVYPVVFVARHAPPADTAVEVGRDGGATARLPQAALGMAPSGWSPLFSDDAGLLARCLGRGLTLADVAQVREAATVAEAYRVAELIVEGGHAAGELRLINTGTIEPYVQQWGRRPTRYLGRAYQRPVVPADTLEAVLPRLGRRAAAPKIVVAGLALRLEACADIQGLALPGKTTVVVTDAGANLWYLLALLNSATATRLYRALFGGQAMQGGYLRVGAAQLGRLPVPRLRLALPEFERDARLAQATRLLDQGDDSALLALATSQASHDLAYGLLAELGRRRSSAPPAATAASLDALIDSLALWCYQGDSV
jgi:hypothetical protein